MFDIPCHRIQFPLDREADQDRNTVSIEFLRQLGIGFESEVYAKLRTLLQEHATRWGKSQVILFDRIGSSKTKDEPLTQEVLKNLLLKLLKDLEKCWKLVPHDVTDVTGMEPVNVPVEVCADYTSNQAGSPEPASCVGY